MPRRFTAAVRPGVYLRVATTGTLAAGDPIDVVDRPAHGVTVAEVFAIVHHERDRAARLLEVPELPSALPPLGPRAPRPPVIARRVLAATLWRSWR